MNRPFQIPPQNTWARLCYEIRLWITVELLFFIIRVCPMRGEGNHVVVSIGPLLKDMTDRAKAGTKP